MKPVYSAATPFLVRSKSRERANAGDGLILDAVEAALKPLRCVFKVSTKEPLSLTAIRKINATKALLIAGGNPLGDVFKVFEDMAIEDWQKIKVPIYIFGAGISGNPAQTRGMTAKTTELLDWLHRQARISSWRCVRSIAYLRLNLPGLDHQFLMTGCPSIYGAPLLAGGVFKKDGLRVVVTCTERGDFLERETAVLRFVSGRFPKAERVLSLHQDYAAGEKTKKNVIELRRVAQAMRFKFFKPHSGRDLSSFYDRSSLHIGSRLHAHLYFLSRAKRSFLVGIDERALGMAETFDFPLCDFKHLDANLGYDFERVRRRARVHHEAFQKFTSYLKAEIMR